MSTNPDHGDSEPLAAPVHEWYWGNGRPCCVNCGALARCDHQYERNRDDMELRAEVARLHEAIADALADLTPGHAPYSVLAQAIGEERP